MFDAKSILDMIVKGAAPAPAPAQQSPGGLGGLGDILGKMMQGGGGAAQRNAAPGQGGGFSLDDLLKQIQGAGQGQPQSRSSEGGGFGDAFRNMLPGGGGQGQPQGQGQPSGGGGLGDILGELQKRMGQGAQQGGAQRPGAAPEAPGGGGLMDILGQILGQATSGVKEGAQRVDDATGIGRHARDAVGQATGQNPDELMRQLKEWIANNPGAAAAGAGGLGAVVLGTKTGRSLAGTAAKLGALVMIGGLAYKAYQNYSQGRPMIGGNFVPEVAPRGSGFEPQAVTQESAALYIKAMIAAAAADGRIDGSEQQKILGGLKQAGVDSEAEEFIANELNNPASAEDLASAVSSQEEAVQLFTAARIAIDLDSQQEHDFLVELAQRLNLDPKLVQHIDAAAQGAAA